IVTMLLLGCNAVEDATEQDPPALGASFEWDYDPEQTVGTACSFETTHFLDRSTGEPTSCLWEFPDGATSTEQNPSVPSTRTRVVGSDGRANMTVTLTVTREDSTDSISHDVIALHC